MKQDNRLKKLVGKKLVIVNEEHPWFESIGRATEFKPVATGGFGLLLKLEGGQSCFVFDYSEVKRLNPEEDNELSQEEIIEALSACNYSPRQIATYLEMDLEKFLEEYNDQESTIRHHYDKGRLTADFEINQKLLNNAKSGNITAAQIFEKNRDRVSTENLKNKIYFA